MTGAAGRGRATHVLILSDLDDAHAVVVAREVRRRGAGCVIVDPADTKLIRLSGVPQDGSLELNGVGIDAGTTVWWRRVRAPRLPADLVDSEGRRFAAAEWRHGLYGLLQATGCRFINDPGREEVANRKPVQLAAAKRVGLHTPRTLITNDPETARAFIAELDGDGKRCVFKPFTGSHRRMVETREILASDLREHELVLAPVIFQERVDRGADIRVTLFGSHCFATQVATQFDELVDWRVDPLVEYRPWSIDAALRGKLARVLAELGLATGSFDLRVNPAGEPVFFEVNPSGQFIFMEMEPGYPVSAAFAEFLLAGADVSSITGLDTAGPAPCELARTSGSAERV